VRGASVEPEIAKITQNNATGGYAAVEFDHPAFVIQPDGTELEFAESLNLNNLLKVNAVGTPRKIRNGFFNFGGWTTGAFHWTERNDVHSESSLSRWAAMKTSWTQLGKRLWGAYPISRDELSLTVGSMRA
jgi:hypothetical protein